MRQVWAWFENQDGQLAIVANQENTSDISDETLDRIAEKSRIVGQFVAKHVYFEMLFYNFMDVIKAIDQFEFDEKNFQFEQEFLPYSTNINRLLINALGSIFTYINHYEQGISDASVSDGVKRLTSIYYDERPLYRFLYKLRNYVIHVDMPVTELLSIEDNPRKEFYIVKSRLLERFDWGLKVTTDLKSFPDRISVKKLVSEALALFVEFHTQLMGNQINEIVMIQQYFDSFGRVIGNQIQYPVVLKIDEDNLGSANIVDLFSDNVFMIQEAMKILGIDAHTGRKVTNQ